MDQCGCTHIDFGRLCESSYRMDVVVKDDDSDHHPQAERHRLLTGESAAVLPKNDTRSRLDMRILKEQEVKPL